MKDIDHYERWMSRTVHDYCKTKAVERLAANAVVTELGIAEHEEEAPVTRPKLRIPSQGRRGRRYAATRRLDPGQAAGQPPADPQS